MPNSAANILVIDDTEVNRYVVARTLQRAGFHVSDGATGEDALRLARSAKPDLIVLDVHLPDISGLEVCRQLKADPATAPIPVLHLSASHVLSEDKVAGLDSGADAYLTQPVDSRELLATVNSLLRARRAEDALRRIQWLLHRSVTPDSVPQLVEQPSYGDLTELNSNRTLLDSVGAQVLREIAGEYLDLLDTSSAIYEVNGDYALRLASSSWCRFLDGASRKLCDTDDNQAALKSGKWLCHESSWSNACLPAIRSRKPVDIEGSAGLRIYALPIIANDEVVGCINVTYNDPPRSSRKLQEIADRYHVTVEQLREHAERYESRPPFIVDIAKKRLHTAARLIGQIVERKRAEQRLNEAKEAAEHANRSKDQFLAVLSHELRTPLTPALAAVSMMQEQCGGDPDMREHLDMIRRNVEMEARLIDDLLDVTRIARGKVQLECKPVLLVEIVRRAIEVCREDLEIRKLKLEVDLGTCSQVLVDADVVRLQQVFWNLLKNAVKFTPDGGSVLVRCLADDGHVTTEVIDTGEGIDARLLPHIFDPFEQGGARVTRQFGGLGLGLTITRGIVEMHGGTISARSEGTGRGATFRVVLPVHEPARVSAVGQVAPEAAAGARLENQQLRVLLVEDHEDTAKIMSLLLRASGHQVAVAMDVASALAHADHGEFDLVVSDLGLPDGSGLDLVRQLRDAGHRGPAIALSGYGQEEDLRRSREAGFCEHLTKPVSPDRLRYTITKVVSDWKQQHSEGKKLAQPS